MASQVALVVKNPPVKAADIRDPGLIPGLGRSPRKGNGNPLQYSCLEKPMDRGAWWATVRKFAKNQTQLKRQHTCEFKVKLHYKSNYLKKSMQSMQTLIWIFTSICINIYHSIK